MKLDKADQAFAKWIKYRDEWKCQRCDTQYTPPTRALHCSHYMGRRKENTRFMPENCDALCWGCHRYFTSHPAEHTDWQVGRKGQDEVDKIKLAASLYRKKDRASEFLYWRQRLMTDFGIKI